MLELTKQIVAENHLTCLMITHNMASALELGNRTIMMDRGHIIHDAAGEKRDGLTVEKLLQEFKNASGAARNNERRERSKGRTQCYGLKPSRKRRRRRRGRRRDAELAFRGEQKDVWVF